MVDFDLNCNPRDRATAEMREELQELRKAVAALREVARELLDRAEPSR